MARKLRLKYDGAIYHITVRGNGRRKIFMDDSDRERFLWRLKESKDTYEVRLYVYCLMENHFHLVVETPRANISRFMQSVLTGYTVYFNLKHNRSGHLMQGRYGAQLVQGDAYLLNLSSYVHANPVRVKSMKEYTPKQKAQYLRVYRWSSYRGYTDSKRSDEFIEYGPLLALMYCRKRDQHTGYRKFVEGRLGSKDREFLELVRTKTRAIGDKDFRYWVDEEYDKLKELMGSQEDVSFRRESAWMEPGVIVGVVAEHFGMTPSELKKRTYGVQARPIAAKLLCKYAGLTQRAAGALLGYKTGAAISIQLKKVVEASQDVASQTARDIARIEKKLEQERP